ncbi:MAG: calcium/sodium antiporter [candidate division KSB1 bacterium]|nr:calcium/sodium antiporter [candidate division KSB1 bacterium]
MLITFMFLSLGFFLIVKGADWLVNGASHLAKNFSISELAIGLAIVAFGTSAPELIVNIIASIQNKSDIVYGNIIGSNQFNLFFILGISGLITPLSVKSSTAWKEIPFSLIAVLVLFVLSSDELLRNASLSQLSRTDGIILVGLFAGFLFYVADQLKNEPKRELKTSNSIGTRHIVFYLIIGLAALFMGGEMVVRNAVEMAKKLGISEMMISLTVVAVGTSLPELATSVTAAVKRNNDIAVGNIIGSNVFNILLVIASSAVIRPIHYSDAYNAGLIVLIAGTLFLTLSMWTGGRRKLDRWEAFILLSGYLIFQTWFIMQHV